MSNKSIVFFPSWAIKVVQRKGLDPVTLLNFNKIVSLFSLNDLAIILRMNSKLKVLLGTDEVYTLYALYDKWYVTASEDNKRLLDNTLLPLSNDLSIDSELQSRMYDSSIYTYSGEKEEKPFITYDLTPEIAIIAIEPGRFSEQTSSEEQLSLIEAVLKVLYMYHPYHVIAGSVWFKPYLRLLSLKRLAV